MWIFVELLKTRRYVVSTNAFLCSSIVGIFLLRKNVWCVSTNKNVYRHKFHNSKHSKQSLCAKYRCILLMHPEMTTTLLNCAFTGPRTGTSRTGALRLRACGVPTAVGSGVYYAFCLFVFCCCCFFR